MYFHPLEVVGWVLGENLKKCNMAGEWLKGLNQAKIGDFILASRYDLMM